MVSNLPRLQIRFPHHHLHRHARHGFDVEWTAKLGFEIARADPPVPRWVEERDGPRCADGDGPESVRVEEEEAVGEVATSREAKEGELLLLLLLLTERELVGGADFVYDGEEEEVVAEGTLGDVFVSVAVVVA